MININLENSNWKFDSSVVPIFDEHVRQSVPLYDEFHKLITDIAGWYLVAGTNLYDIGTSTGRVLKNIKSKYNTVDIKYIGIDSSKDMIDKLSSEVSDLELLNVDVTDNFKFHNASLITSVLTMQFIAEKDRIEVLNNVYDGLNKGSAFIMVEKVIGANSRFNEIYIELYHEMKLNNGLTPEHILAKAKAIRGVMKPYTVKENIELLEGAGFKDIDIFFKWNNFVGFIAVK